MGGLGSGPRCGPDGLGQYKTPDMPESVWDGLWRPGGAFFQIGLGCVMSHHHTKGFCTFLFKLGRENSKWSSSKNESLGAGASGGGPEGPGGASWLKRWKASLKGSTHNSTHQWLTWLEPWSCIEQRRCISTFPPVGYRWSAWTCRTESRRPGIIPGSTAVPYKRR